jgi:DNA-binding response OmpR family regulator
MDDDEQTRAFLRRVLAEAGYMVEVFGAEERPESWV